MMGGLRSLGPCPVFLLAQSLEAGEATLMKSTQNERMLRSPQDPLCEDLLHSGVISDGDTFDGGIRQG